MEIDVRTWLEGLGLGEYTNAFEENCVDGHVLPFLTSDDLKEIGIKAVGHRRRLLEAISALDNVDQSDEPAAGDISQNPAGPLLASERRQVTVLFADLCGFTSLSSSIDSEETHQILAAYFERADGVIREFGGTVDKHVGDSVMAVFGAPVAHDNDAERAVRAAIAIQEAMPKISANLGRKLEVHIGVACGEVVASGVGPDRHYTVTGDSVNLAARLTDKATAGETLISEMVRQSFSAGLETTDIGEISVKGLDTPVRAFSVLGSRSSSEAQLERPIIGRLAEIRQFQNALEICQDAKNGQLIQIRGDAGIGKTRLTNEFCRMASERGFVSHRSHILDFGVRKGQDPVRLLVQNLLELPAKEGIERRVAAVRQAISNEIIAREDEIHLNDLLDLPQSTDHMALYDAMDNTTRNAGKLATVVSLVQNLSAKHPRLIVFEDLHWADEFVLKQIATIARGTTEYPVIFVITSRNEGNALDLVWRGLVGGMSCMTLDLGPLSPTDAMNMTAGFVKNVNDFAKTCVERSEGNPLFLEQLLRSAEEAGDVQVPGSIKSIVQARLDKLPPKEKMVVQAASVLGQKFPLAALRHLIGDPGFDCSLLVAQHFVLEQDEDYLFTHALVRDATYGSLLRSRRKELHLAAADWFADSDLPLRAEHLERAGHDSAAQAYRDAAEAQMKALRLENARSLVERGIAVARDPATLFSLNCMLGELLRELGEPELSIEAYQQAYSQRADETDQCVALIGIAEGMRIVDRTDEALDLLDQAKPIAEAHDLKEALMRLHHLRGNLLFPKGDIAGCEEGHRKSIELAKEIESAEGEACGLGGLGDAAYVAGRMLTSHDMLSQCVEICRRQGFGRTEVANAAQICHTKIYQLQLRETIEYGRAAIEAARRVGHDRAELNAGAACLFASTELGDWSLAEDCEKHVRMLAERLGSVRFSNEAKSFKSILLNATGRSDEALSTIRSAISAGRKLGLSFGGPRMLGHLVRISPDREEQDQALAEAEAIIERGCVGHNHPFFYRDAIEVMLERGDWGKAGRYTDALADFPQGETLPWSRYFVARARTLSAWNRGDQGDDTISSLIDLRDEARRIGLVYALPALNRALDKV